MSYVSLGNGLDVPACGPGQVYDGPTAKCIDLACPAGYQPYYGQCLSPEDQRELGPSMCRADEDWVASELGCRCKAGLTRSASGGCVSASSLPAGAPKGADVRPVSQAGLSLGRVEIVAAVAALAGAGALAYYYLT